MAEMRKSAGGYWQSATWRNISREAGPAAEESMAGQWRG